RPVHSLRLLFSSLRWLAGFAVGLAGWALYVAALAVAPLSPVPSTSAGGIGLLALLVERTTGTSRARREWVSVGAAVGGLVLLGISLAGQETGGRHGDPAIVGAWIGVSCAAALLAAVRLPGGVGFGVSAGVL